MAYMSIEAFLERVPAEDISVLRCSICKEQFHTSPLGPRKPINEFVEHVRTVHPQAVIPRKDIKRLYQRT
jgi:type IV secretory pathway TrbF-like protein